MLPIQPIDQPLHVVTVISNPVRYRSRYHLFRQFEKQVTDAGAILHVVEAAYGERPFEITDPNNPNHLQLRTGHEIWHKENMCNLGIQRLPKDWKYCAWVDADITFARPDWVQETIQQLQHYSFVQMFSHALDLGPGFAPYQHHKGFVWSYYKHMAGDPEAPKNYEWWHPGFAWAVRRDAFDNVGGLIDWGVLGSADRHMACSMIGQVDRSFFPKFEESCPNYVTMCRDWQDRCNRHIRRNIGYVDGLVLHYFHGKKKDRGYRNRWKMLNEHHFDPIIHLKRDWQGLWQLDDDAPGFRDACRSYFRSRNEDSNEL